MTTEQKKFLRDAGGRLLKPGTSFPKWLPAGCTRVWLRQVHAGRAGQKLIRHEAAPPCGAGHARSADARIRVILLARYFGVLHSNRLPASLSGRPPPRPKYAD